MSVNDSKVWTRDQVLLLIEKFLAGMSETAIARMVGHPKDGGNRLRKLIGGNSKLDRSIHRELIDNLHDDDLEPGYHRTDRPWTKADQYIYQNWKKQKQKQEEGEPDSYTVVEMTETLLQALLRRDEDCKVLNAVLTAKKVKPTFDLCREREEHDKCLNVSRIVDCLQDMINDAQSRLNDLRELLGESDE